MVFCLKSNFLFKCVLMTVLLEGLYFFLGLYLTVMPSFFRQMCMFGDNDCYSNIEVLRRDMWVMPMLGLSAMNVLVILAFEIFVICKATGNSPSRR